MLANKIMAMNSSGCIANRMIRKLTKSITVFTREKRAKGGVYKMVN